MTVIAAFSGQFTALAIESRGVRAQQAESDIEAAEKARDEAAAAAEEAARKAAAAEEDGGFWGDVADVAGDAALIAGTVAAVAATGGGALAVVVVAGAALQVAGRVGEEAGMNTTLTAGMQITGGLVTAGASVATGNVAAVSTLSQTASLASAGATGVKGGAMGAEGYYRAGSLHNQADGRAAEGRGALAAVDSDRGMSDLQRATKDSLALEAAARDLDTQMQKHRSQMIGRIGGA